jgi:hypothetical protein
MSNQQLAQQLIEQWEAAAQAATNPPDPNEAAKDFGEFVSQHLSPRGN